MIALSHANASTSCPQDIPEAGGVTGAAGGGVTGVGCIIGPATGGGVTGGLTGGVGFEEEIEASPKVKLTQESQLKLDRLLSSSKNHLQAGIDFKELSKKNQGLISVKKLTQIESEPKSNEQPAKNEFSSLKEKNSLPLTVYDHQSEEDKKIKRIQKETVEHLKRSNKSQLQPSDKDSLFNKVSKAYLRNMQKVIVEED